MSTTKKLAVLIDADNISADVIEYLLLEINKFGIASVKRIYGDWTDTKLNKWKDTLLPYAITPIQQFAYTNGKNATDMAMVIDAMDLLYSNTFDGFCLVSSDSDFTRLASRIRENGIEVIGFGQNKTPEAFVKACDKFVRTELLMPVKETNIQTTVNTTAPPTNTAATPQVQNIATPAATPSAAAVTKTNQATAQAKTPDLKHLTHLIKQACQAHADDKGWTKLGTIGTYLTRVMPDFDVRHYQFDKLSTLINSLSDSFHVELNGSVYSIQCKNTSKKQWSKEELNMSSELINLLSQHISNNADSNGWAYLGDVVKSIGSQRLSQYGFAKASTLFEQINTIELQNINGKLCVKKFWGISKICAFINQTIETYKINGKKLTVHELANELRIQPLVNHRILGFDSIVQMILKIRPEHYQFIADTQSAHKIIKKRILTNLPSGK